MGARRCGVVDRLGGTPVTLRPTPPTGGGPGPGPHPFHVLAKPTGPICNLDCDYCFFLSKEALYPGDRFRMAEDVLDAYVTQLLSAHPDGDVTVAWQGGEPTLMGVEFFRRAVDLVEQRRRPGQRVQHTMQTNGTLLDDEWGALLARYRFLVGISIDGPPELHDAHRHDKRGGPTAAKVLRGLDVLRRHGVDVNVLCTVNAANQDRPLEVYRWFRDDLGLRHIQFIPIVEVEGDVPAGTPAPVTDRSVDPAAWGRFLVAVFDEWVVRDVGEVFVQMFDAALASWLGLPGTMCIFRETCGDAMALEHNGDLYSCDHFVEPAHLLGNIRRVPLGTLVASPQQVAFGRAKLDTLPRTCLECEVRFACNGECPKNRIDLTEHGEPGLNHLCAGYKAFFTHIDGCMRRMADLLRQGRFADEVMDVLTRAPRNQPCPCGSGRKAKHCHARA